MPGDFGNVRFDPEAEKATVEKNFDQEKAAGVYPDGYDVRRGSMRKGSAYSRARNSIAKEPGWEKRKSNPMSMKGSLSAEGADGAEEIDYSTLKWWQAGFIMIAETVSLGILSLPSVLGTIGMVPGIILIACFGVIATYTGYVIGQFRLRYPWIHSFGDAGEILGEPIKCGRFFQELFGWAQTLFQIFTMSSHILTFSICLNTITDSATCTVVWGIVGLVIFWLLDLPRTLGSVSYMSIASFLSVFTAVMVTLIDVAVTKPIGDGRLAPTKTLGFTEAFLSVSNIVFAYAGHSCFFGFIAEMRDPTEWPKALAMLQTFDTSLYLVAAIVIYVFAGDHVASPALGSATGVVKKVAWGIALPTIIIAGVIYGHIAAKYIFVRLFRGTKHMNSKTKLSSLTWIGITLIIWVVSWIIAESIPKFNDLLGLISALFASWFTFGIPGIFWLFMNYEGGAKSWFSSPKKIFLFCCNVGVTLIGLTVCILGLWSSGVAIATGSGGASWSCRSNAQ